MKTFGDYPTVELEYTLTMTNDEFWEWMEEYLGTDAKTPQSFMEDPEYRWYFTIKPGDLDKNSKNRFVIHLKASADYMLVKLRWG